MTEIFLARYLKINGLMLMDVSLPYWRLSFFYFVYFSSLAGLSPYFGLFLTKIGCDPRQIGELTAIILFTKLIAPNIWSWLGDCRNILFYRHFY